MLTITRDCVPDISAKFTRRRDPSDDVNVIDPTGALEFSALSAAADNNGTASIGLPIRLAWSEGAASTVPVESTSTDMMPGRPERLVISFDIQSSPMLAMMTASESAFNAETG